MALGLIPLVAPLLSIRRVGGVFRLPSSVRATLITSRNAVSGCPAQCHDLVLFAVGNATAACASAAGFRHVKSAEGDAAALATLVTDTLTPCDGSIFFPTGRGQGTQLATALRQKGFRVLRHVVYQAVAVPALPIAAETHLRHRDVATAMFFSAETARCFVQLMRAAGLEEAVRDVAAVSISEQSTVALRRLPWRRISVAGKPNQDAMLALLK
jgi:uroporphyrinogen-III synthase